MTATAFRTTIGVILMGAFASLATAQPTRPATGTSPPDRDAARVEARGSLEVQSVAWKRAADGGLALTARKPVTGEAWYPAYAYEPATGRHRVAVAFSARGADGRPRYRLDASDVELAVDGRRVSPEALELERGYFGDEGLHVVLVLDQSLSLSNGALERYKSAGRRLIQNLESGDRVTILAATHESSPARLAEREPVAAGGADLGAAIADGIEPRKKEGAPPSEQTSVRVRDAVAAAIRMLEDASSPLERRAIVVLSGMHDSASHITADALARRAADGPAPVAVLHRGERLSDARAAERLADHSAGEVVSLEAASLDRAWLAGLAAPHWVVRADVGRRMLPADGRNHRLTLRLADGAGGSVATAALFETRLENPVSRLARVLEIVVPVFAVLVLVAGVFLIALQRRRGGGAPAEARAAAEAEGPAAPRGPRPTQHVTTGVQGPAPRAAAGAPDETRSQ